MFPLQNRCDGLIDCARMVRSQFLGLQNSPIFSVTDESYGFAQFSLQDKIRKCLMVFLRSLIPTIFSEVPHGGVIRVFHEFFKLSTITQVKLKQNALSDLRGILNTLCVLEHNGKKFQIITMKK